MAKALTIFNIIAGAASIVGMLIALNVDNQPLFISAIFVISLVISGYVLFVPDTFLEDNVRSKIMYFENPVQNEENDQIMIQRGKFKIGSRSTVGVKFRRPFKNPPEVEVVNYHGYSEEPPTVKYISPEHVTFHRYLSVTLFGNQTYEWIARGFPLTEA